ncbi:MAG: transferase [Glaciimonas sp.]|nr:transferase [Glaciimonas sp.]
MPNFYIHKCKTLFAIIIIQYRTLCFRGLKLLNLHNMKAAKGVKIVQRISAQGRGTIEVGKESQLGVYPSPGFKRGEFYLEARNATAQILIGENVFINNDCVIIADKSIIEIGDYTLIGPSFFCVDSDFHPLDPTQRLTTNYNCQSVKIGRNVFIGARVTILKGVNIGDDAVIAAGSMVIKDVPSGVVFAGNPGKVVRYSIT